jgi:hypothetical protein
MAAAWMDGLWVVVGSLVLVGFAAYWMRLWFATDVDDQVAPERPPGARAPVIPVRPGRRLDEQAS